jgi:hypothetical protein
MFNWFRDTAINNVDNILDMFNWCGNTMITNVDNILAMFNWCGNTMITNVDNILAMTRHRQALNGETIWRTIASKTLQMSLFRTGEANTSLKKNLTSKL